MNELTQHQGSGAREGRLRVVATVKDLSAIEKFAVIPAEAGIQIDLG
ncbi:MAG TPA: hypothetical protein VLC97_06305 [Rhodanobacteraceae bacterium]|nr:hypothetical protein [Rhodanobacteraceae bacterium]